MRVPRDVANTRFRDVSVLSSDGRTAERPPVPVGFDRVIVADFESHRIALNRCAEIATLLKSDVPVPGFIHQRCPHLIDVCKQVQGQ